MRAKFKHAPISAASGVVAGVGEQRAIAPPLQKGGAVGKLAKNFRNVGGFFGVNFSRF